MPSLTQEAVQKFWSEYEDPMIYRVICFMEGVEQWTVDGGNELESSLEALGKELDNLENVELAAEDKLIQLAGVIKTGRSLRLLQAIDTAHPGAASKLLIHAEEVSQSEDDPPGIFLRRNIVFERLRLMTRIFAPQRMSLILKALEEEDHD